MRIDNMCKSIKSEEVDEQFLDDWQRKGLGKTKTISGQNFMSNDEE